MGFIKTARTSITTLCLASLLLAPAIAQQTTIDFEGLPIPQYFWGEYYGPPEYLVTDGYSFTGGGGGPFGPEPMILKTGESDNTSTVLSAWGDGWCQDSFCPWSGIQMKSEDGGPFALHAVDFYSVGPAGEPGIIRGKTTTGEWVPDGTPFGTGEWLNVVEVGFESDPGNGFSGYGSYVEIDNLVVAYSYNAEIELNPFGANDELRPNDAYFFTVGVRSLSIAVGDARDFDATTIDPSSVSFGPDQAPNLANPLTADFDNDGIQDIVFGFQMADTGISCIAPNGDVTLVATTTGGEIIAGIDTAVRIGCGNLQTLDFEELAPGTSPILSKGYIVSGDATLEDRGGDIVVSTALCTSPNPDGCWNWHARQTVSKADNSPFALYNYDLNGFLGNCIGGVCGITGITTWGEEASGPLGTGDWLSLQSVEFDGDHLDTEGGYCSNCQFWIDDLVVADALAVEIDFDPWNTANEIKPKSSYLITVQITNTNVADGDAFDFDPASIDPATLRLGPNQAETVATPLDIDLDGDGDIDRIFGFRMEDTGNTCTQSSIVLTGTSLTGIVFAATDTVAPIECEEPLAIDVEPYNPNNRVFPNDDYEIQVVVMTTSVADGDPFDSPNGLEASTLKFGPGEATAVSSLAADVDGDGDTDRIYNFEMADSGIACGDTEVELSGEKYVSGGDITIPMTGIDFIQTEDCETGGCHP
jgi:hypothetical protein